MPCHQIVLHIDRGLDFLSTPVRNVPDRHRSLRAVFDQSWNLLSDTERRVLAEFSVFRGGFDLEAAAQVAGASLPLLASLADKSLIRVIRTTRYDLHELVREYLSEKLTAWSDGDTRGVTRRHFDFYASLAEQANAHVYGP
jgi:predicted ATPase